MRTRILAFAETILRHRRREWVLKTMRRDLDDRGLADVGLNRTPGPMDFTFER